MKSVKCWVSCSHLIADCCCTNVTWAKTSLLIAYHIVGGTLCVLYTLYHNCKQCVCVEVPHTEHHRYAFIISDGFLLSFVSFIPNNSEHDIIQEIFKIQQNQIIPAHHFLVLRLVWYVYAIWPLAAVCCWTVGERLQFGGSTENMVEHCQYFVL
jgi:hypothetical protein